MRDQYRTARRVVGHTFYPNLWIVEKARSITAVAIDNMNDTPDTVNLDSVAKNCGFQVPAYAIKSTQADGDTWSGWKLYGTDGMLNPFEGATRAEIIDYLVMQFPGGTLCAPPKPPNAASVSRMLRKAGWWIISNQSGAMRSGIRVVQIGRGVLAHVAVRIWVDEWTPAQARDAVAEMRDQLTAAGYRLAPEDGRTSHITILPWPGP
jgi:hypothetical protein